MKNRLFLLLLMAVVSIPAFSQSKAEVKQYEKTLAKPSVKAYERFLKRYPQSVYYDQIASLRDSTDFETVDKSSLKALRDFKGRCKTHRWKEKALEAIDVVETSPLTTEEILSAAQSLNLHQENGQYLAYRSEGKDYLLAFRLGDNLVLTVYEKNGAEWTLHNDFHINKEYIQDGLNARLIAQAQIVRVQELRLVRLRYLSEKDLYAEYVQMLLNPLTGESDAVIFYGHNAKTSKDKQAYKIEGQSPQALSNAIVTAQMQYLVNDLNQDENLSIISEEDALTDDSIQWWLQNNPSAGDGKKRSVRFGTLDPRCGLVAAFKKAKKDKSSRYRAALFDIRGYTVICVQDLSSGNYSLAWCERQCQNKKRDRLLNTIYFENETSLALFYYHGRKSFKRHLSLAAKKIS
jgi:hypothetical protein